MRYFALYVLVFLSLTGWAAGGDMAGRIEKLDGEGRVQRGQTVIPAGTGLELYAEDVVFTEEWSSIGIVLQDGSILFHRRSEERRVGKECRSRWSPYH